MFFYDNQDYVAIEANRFVIEYVGEILTHEEAENRGTDDSTYLFDLDFYYPADTNCAFTIDAGQRGNAARFINHSCDPNVFIMPVLINNVDVRLHRLAVMTRRAIGCVLSIPCRLYLMIGYSAGQELTMDYEGLAREATQRPPPRAFFGERTADIGMQCLCGGTTCRGFIRL